MRGLGQLCRPGRVDHEAIEPGRVKHEGFRPVLKYSKNRVKLGVND